MLKRITTRSLVALFLLAPFSAMAHGKEAHGKQAQILGTVKKVGTAEIFVETAKETLEIHIGSETRFLRSGEAATLTDLKVGDRVAVEASPHSGHTLAAVVKWGAPPARKTERR
ncbi:MAG: hypothetical protein ACYC8T_06075 [Myxococcaceae bacterium]